VPDLKIVSQNNFDHYLHAAHSAAETIILRAFEQITHSKTCESPIETGLLFGFIARWLENRIWRLPEVTTFYDIATELTAEIFIQKKFGRYRADFGIHVTASADGKFLDKWFAIECDGHDFHNTRDAAKRDRSRDREMIADGITVIRFTGSEIYEDAVECAEQVERIITSMYATWLGNDYPEFEPWGIPA